MQKKFGLRGYVGKRIITDIQSILMAKKSTTSKTAEPKKAAGAKPVQKTAAKSAATKAAKASPKAKTAAPKATRTRVKATAVTKVAASITPADIALRAYFISEKRQKLGLRGDSTHDWVEAERQLKSEAALQAKK